MASPFIVMINPKTLELVQVFMQTRSGNRGSAGFRMSLLSDPRVCIANCWTDADEEVSSRGKDYARIHSAGTCGPHDAADFGPNLEGVSSGYKGKGYGMMVYVAAAVGVTYIPRSRFDGVFSPKGGPNHNRSRDADALWDSMVDKGISKEEEIEHEGEPETDTRRYCVDIDPGTYVDRDEEWMITDDRVCDDVSVEKSGFDVFDVNTLLADNVLDLPFVLWASEEEVEGPPGDLLVRAHVEDRKTATSVINQLRDYDRENGTALVQAFMSRPEIAALYGGQGLLGSPGGARLPPVSRETRRLLELFEDMP